MERITELINHPERLDRDTLYELRSMIALYPYYQPARLLMLQNLFLLHDPTFDEELRRAAIYITDRRVLFNMIEGAHYQLKKHQAAKTEAVADKGGSRTMTLIDNFLDSIPKDAEEETKTKRKPTPADAAVDYVAYLLETEEETNAADESIPEMKGQDLIDSFINADKGRFELKVEPELKPTIEKLPENDDDGGEQEIIQRLSLQFPKKNAYFADQIRFLEKLIINNNKK